MTNGFINYFHIVFVNDGARMDESVFDETAARSMENLTFAEEGIFSLFLNIDTKKVIVPDKIPS